jgi:putative ABC transport system permease protein
MTTPQPWSWAGWRLAAVIARRELRGGLRALGVLVACLALGVAAIAGVATVRGAIASGMAAQGAQILGGDVQVELTYRFANEAELAFLQGNSVALSAVAEFRSMATFGPEDAQSSALVQAKTVDAAYPLIGQVKLVGGGDLASALVPVGGLHGVVAEQVLVDQLGLKIGDTFKLAGNPVRLGGILISEPDSATAGFAFAPRAILRDAAIAGTGLLAPGTLYDSAYRMRVAPGTDLDALKAQMLAAFPDNGLRWADRRNPSPQVAVFVDRIGSFLVLVGLAGLAVGGVGVASAVRVYLDGKIATIATLRTLGAPGWLIFRSYLMQIAVLAGVGILLGLVLGLGLPLAFAPLIEAALPFPADISASARPGLEAAAYGLLSGLLFALGPLSRTERVTAASLYRGDGSRGWPRAPRLVAISLTAVALIGLSAWASGMWELALWTAAGIAGALVVLAGAGWLVVRAARGLGRAKGLNGRPGLRLAVASIGSRGSDAALVVLALGLGLTTLATVGQIDANLRRAIAVDLPDRAPAFFFVDIQPDQIAPFRAALAGVPTVTEITSAPMLRGLLTRINGRDAREVAGDHWVVEGDRGISYAEVPPEGTKITAGKWWGPEALDPGAPAEVSFAEEEAMEMGLKLGDLLVINVLGREIEARITSLRSVDFSNAGMGFVMILSPGPLISAPHSHIATVYADPTHEAEILRLMTRDFPNVTAVSVRVAAARVTDVLTAIARATTIAASVTLLTGFAVLIGVAAAGERARRYEAAILKVLGASRARILWSFALRSVLLGLVAGLVAVAAAALGSWAVITLVMEGDFSFFPVPAIITVASGVALTLISGLALSRQSMNVTPAQVLRNRE